MAYPSQSCTPLRPSGSKVHSPLMMHSPGRSRLDELAAACKGRVSQHTPLSAPALRRALIAQRATDTSALATSFITTRRTGCWCCAIASRLRLPKRQSPSTSSSARMRWLCIDSAFCSRVRSSTLARGSGPFAPADAREPILGVHIPRASARQSSSSRCTCGGWPKDGARVEPRGWGG